MRGTCSSASVTRTAEHVKPFDTEGFRFGRSSIILYPSPQGLRRSLDATAFPVVAEAVKVTEVNNDTFCLLSEPPSIRPSSLICTLSGMVSGAVPKSSLALLPSFLRLPS